MITLAVSGATGTAAFQFPLRTCQIVSPPSRSSLSMSSSPATGSGPGLQYDPDNDQDEKNKGNYRRLSDALQVFILYVRTFVCSFAMLTYC